MGPTRFRRPPTSTCAPPSRSTPRAGRTSAREDARLPLGHLPRRADARPRRSASATTSASRPGSRCRASTARRCAASIVTQGDTEPASVEQQRLLGHTCPSLYDLRNLFQVNVEEGRHLWAMVYLLHAYFGRDGREEAEELLAAPFRRRRQAAHPRHLQRADHRLALLLHVHVLHRPRRQVPAQEPGRERLRSAGAHLPLHADRGGAPHVRRRDRHRPRRQAHAAR